MKGPSSHFRPISVLITYSSPYPSAYPRQASLRQTWREFSFPQPLVSIETKAEHNDQTVPPPIPEVLRPCTKRGRPNLKIRPCLRRGHHIEGLGDNVCLDCHRDDPRAKVYLDRHCDDPRAKVCLDGRCDDLGDHVRLDCRCDHLGADVGSDCPPGSRCGETVPCQEEPSVTVCPATSYKDFIKMDIVGVTIVPSRLPTPYTRTEQT